MVDAGLNAFQILQNELLAREGNRQTMGLGFRLAIIEDKIGNAEATAKNGRVWKLNHALVPLKCLTPDARRRAETERRRLAKIKGADRRKDEKDPVKHMRDNEIWEVCRCFPRTLLEFKELQFHPADVQECMDFYFVRAYDADMRAVDLDSLADVEDNMEACMEELAMSWGLDWMKIEGLSLPPRGSRRTSTGH